MGEYCYNTNTLFEKDGRLWVTALQYDDKKYSTEWDLKAERYNLIRLLPGPYEVTHEEAGMPHAHYRYVLDSFYETITPAQFIADNAHPKDYARRAWGVISGVYRDAGYEGTLPPGVGNALRVFVKACPEYADCVRRGPATSIKVSGMWEYEYLRIGYLFKSPVLGYTAIDLLKLCRLLKKHGKRYAEVIKRLAENPHEAEEARGLLALDTLAKGFI